MAAPGVARVVAPGRTEVILAASSAAALGAFVLTAFWGWSYDDPFITYRYALNARNGAGLVYNPGEAVLSTTAPLFALMLSALANPALDLPHVAAAIGAVSMAAGGLAMFALARRAGLRAGAWACLALYPTFPLLAVTMSSETPLYLALCLWAFVAAAWGKAVPAGLLAGLAIFSRGDGALAAALAGAMLVGPIMSLGRRAVLDETLRYLAGLLVALAPWLAFATAYYGSPIPVTLGAKQAQGAMPISTGFAAGLPVVLSWYASGAYHAVQAGVAVAGLAHALARSRPVLWLVGWSALYFAAYTALGVSGYFWYYAPLTVGFIAAVSAGIDALIAMSGASRPAARVAIAAVVVGLLALQARDVAALGTMTDARMRIYRAAGEWLAENTPPEAKVGALEIGVIGYYSSRPVVDFAGLIQPAQAATLRREQSYDLAAVAALAAYRPDYVVYVEGSLPRFEAMAVPGQCARAATLRGDAYGYNSSVVIARCE